MIVKFMGILTEDVVLKAVESNGYALRYVIDKEMFITVANKLNIEIEGDL